MWEQDYAEIFARQDIKDVIAQKAAYGVGMLWLVQHGRCYWCNRICIRPCKKERRVYGNKTLPVDFFTLDHIQSRWQGGGSGVDNVVGSCYRCNNFRNSTEHKREVGRQVAANQPEELRLKRFLQTDAITIPFAKGLTRREKKKHLALSVLSWYLFSQLRRY